MAERDYVLGTHDVEIQRLGLQHRVWRSEVLAGWHRVGIRSGWKVLDVGSGPGYATVDLAEIVGPAGQVTGIERSERFLEFAKAQCSLRGLDQVEFLERDLMEEGLGPTGFDAAWCRWVASFVPDPRRLVQNMAGALRTGGRVIFHDYVNYGSWQMTPPSESHESFVQAVIANWKASGGDPFVGARLPQLLLEAGFRLIETRPLVFAIRPGDFFWEWPRSFIESHVPRLIELERIDGAKGAEILRALENWERDPATIMLTPMVIEIIAEKA